VGKRSIAVVSMPLTLPAGTTSGDVVVIWPCNQDNKRLKVTMRVVSK
jgi:hypothetical protein